MGQAGYLALQLSTIILPLQNRHQPELVVRRSHLLPGRLVLRSTPRLTLKVIL